MKFATGLSVFSCLMMNRTCFCSRSLMSLALPIPRSFHCSSRHRKSFVLIFIRHSKFSSPDAIVTLGRSTYINQHEEVSKIFRSGTDARLIWGSKICSFLRPIWFCLCLCFFFACEKSKKRPKLSASKAKAFRYIISLALMFLIHIFLSFLDFGLAYLWKSWMIMWYLQHS